MADKLPPQNIMQAFRLANGKITEDSSSDDTIAAYDEVLHFCAGSEVCRLERSVKRDMLLYWVYCNIADAYIKKDMPTAACLYYEKALAMARFDEQKISVLEKMLDATGVQDLKVADKCRKIMDILTQLTKAYTQQGNQEGIQRIRNLEQKTSAVLKKTKS